MARKLSCGLFWKVSTGRFRAHQPETAGFRHSSIALEFSGPFPDSASHCDVSRNEAASVLKPCRACYPRVSPEKDGPVEHSEEHRNGDKRTVLLEWVQNEAAKNICGQGPTCVDFSVLSTRVRTMNPTPQSKTNIHPFSGLVSKISPQPELLFSCDQVEHGGCWVSTML